MVGIYLTSVIHLSGGLNDTSEVDSANMKLYVTGDAIDTSLLYIVCCDMQYVAYM